MKTIQINDEYLSLVPELSKKERWALKSSIMENGVREPIIVNSDGIVLDGHNRLQICEELGIESPVLEKNFATKEQEKNYVIESNLIRRQLNAFQKVEMLYKLHHDEINISKRKRGIAGTNNSEKLRLRDKLGDRVGLSGKTVFNAIYVLERADEKTKHNLRIGHISIYSAYTQLKNNEKNIQKRTHGNITLNKILHHFKNNPIISSQLKEIIKIYQEDNNVNLINLN